jgi:hypothetical protein
VVHGLDLLDAFAFKPGTDLEWRDDFRASPIRDLDHVGYVVAVAVRKQDEIGRDFGDIDLLRERIRRNEGIEEERFAAGFYGETGMAVIRKFHADK